MVGQEPTIKKAYCRYCKEGVFALTEKHVLYLLKAHEIACAYAKQGELNGASAPDASNHNKTQKEV